MKVRLIFPVVLFAIFVVFGVSNGVNADCEKPEAIQLSRAIYNGTKRTWYVPLSSKLEPYRSQRKGYRYPPESYLSSRRCWIASVYTPKGRVHIPFVCSFEKYEEEYCVLKTEKTELKYRLKLYGDFRVTKTDNSSYYVLLGCTFGEEAKQFWFVISKRRTLNETVTEDILEHVRKLGFKRDDISDHIYDMYVLTKLQSVTCLEKDFPYYNRMGISRRNPDDNLTIEIESTTMKDGDDNKDDKKGFLKDIGTWLKTLLENYAKPPATPT